VFQDFHPELGPAARPQAFAHIRLVHGEVAMRVEDADALGAIVTFELMDFLQIDIEQGGCKAFLDADNFKRDVAFRWAGRQPSQKSPSSRSSRFLKPCTRPKIFASANKTQKHLPTRRRNGGGQRFVKLMNQTTGALFGFSRLTDGRPDMRWRSRASAKRRSRLWP